MLAFEQSDLLFARTRSGLASVDKFYNMVYGFGQSLEFSASVTIPPLTLDSGSGADTDSLMMGNSVRPAGVTDTFDPIGTDQFNLLLATADNNGILLTDFTPPWSTSYSGEAPMVAGIHHMKRLWNSSKGVINDTDHLFVGAICAKGETTLADISNPSGNTYLRTVDCANVFKGLADAASKTSGVVACSFAHGEADVGTATATYKTGLRTYMDNVFDDICDGIFGQTGTPLWLAQPPSKRWNSDNFYIEQAFLEFEEENDDLVIALPSYACQSDQNAANQHLTANGARFSGLKRAQAMAKILFEGQNFFIPRIYKVWQKNNVLYVGYISMSKIQFKPIWERDSFDRSLLPNYGFTVFDGGIEQTIISIYIVKDNLIEITLSTTPSAAILHYAGETNFDGRGNVCDSDSTISPLEYIYDINQDSAANIPELVGQAYDMWNFALPQKVVAELL